MHSATGITKPTVAINSNGYIAASYIIGDAVYGSYYNAVTSIWEQVNSEIISFSGLNPSYPRLAVNSSNEAVIVFNGTYLAESKVYKSYYNTASSNWVALTAANPFNLTGIQQYSYIDLDNNNSSIVSWIEGGIVNSCISAHTTVSGTACTLTGLNSNLSSDAAIGRIKVDNSGGAMTVWQQTDNGTTDTDSIFFAKYNGSIWTVPLAFTDRINPAGTPAINPQISMSEDGTNAAVVWIQKDSSGFHQIFLSRF